MQTRDIPTPELKAMLAATAKLVGPGAFVTRVLRRELERREQPEPQPLAGGVTVQLHRQSFNRSTSAKP